MSELDIAPVVKQLSQEQVQRYADASSDHNPIHIDEDYARATPFGGTIAHGMLILASISEMMAAACGEAWITRGKLRVRFRAPAKTSDTITASAKAQTPHNGARIYGVECRNQDGELLISGSAEVPLDG
ncbi:MAG: MaoC family dehydratase [Dehalococcoidia bacterium]